MNELLNGIVVTTNVKSHDSDYKELFPLEIYHHPPTRKERRKRERELKKKFPLDLTKFIKSHRT
jgi:hypothetical protein